MEILRIENLSFKYPKAERNAISNISLNIRRGEFIVICGESGCGKTTLLKHIKPELVPIGEKSGEVYYKGINMNAIDAKTSASEIGFVLQNPDSQIVTDKVWHELAFGLENLGTEQSAIRLRVGEMANYFGIQDWFRADTDKLSGGQKQLLNLAAIMVMQPKILILDEPTSQLDPIAASDFIATLQKLNRELGLTIILSEHRLEEVFPIADRVILMEDGKVLLCDTPRNIGKRLDKNHKMQIGLPSAVRIYNGLSIEDECPLTVKEGRDFLEAHFSPKEGKVQDYKPNKKIALTLKDLWFRYEKDGNDLLRGCSMTLHQGEFLCILGGNGVGKTTLLNLISRLEKPYRGKIITDKADKIAYLPQDPLTLFLKDSIREDMEDTAKCCSVPNCRLTDLYEELGITHLLDRHPYDLSGGEVQKCATAKVLLTEPKILLLDEPTKGLDAFAKAELAKLLKRLKNNGISILAVSHDAEFAAENADRCGLFFDGEILAADVPQKFFAENSFYTTAASRMARDIFPNAVTCKQVIDYC